MPKFWNIILPDTMKRSHLPFSGPSLIAHGFLVFGGTSLALRSSWKPGSVRHPPWVRRRCYPPAPNLRWQYDHASVIKTNISSQSGMQTLSFSMHFRSYGFLGLLVNICAALLSLGVVIYYFKSQAAPLFSSYNNGTIFILCKKHEIINM